MPRSCVVLLSGGLDSLLVTRLMAAQGLMVTAVHTINCFHSSEKTEARMARLQHETSGLGVHDIIFPDITEDVISTVRKPHYGYGKNLNPCIDCRLKTVAAGFKVMREIGADFVVSGEVVGQRPMSQRRDAIGLADKEVAAWGFPGLFLRPLSARLLPKTVPEIEGWVDPEMLYDISGRGRSRQMALASDLGINTYPNPAGGCLLTDSGFSERLADLMRFTPDWKADDVELIKVGRHFLPTETVRIVVSRREEENYRLEELAAPGDLLFVNAEQNGAIVLVRGKETPEIRSIAAGLAVYYSKHREAGKAHVSCWSAGSEIDNANNFSASVVDPDAIRTVEETMKQASGILPLARKKKAVR